MGALARKCNFVIARHEAISLPASMGTSVLAGVLTRQCNFVIARHEAISLPASMDISVLAGALTRQRNFVIARHEAISLPMFSRQPLETLISLVSSPASVVDRRSPHYLRSN